MFGSGVILATALVHMLIPADQNLTNPCLSSVFTDTYTGFAGAFCLAAILFLHLLQFLISSYLTKESDDKLSQSKMDLVNPESGTQSTTTSGNGSGSGSGGAVDDAHEHSHAHGHLINTSSHAHKVAVYILELGIASHSVIIGMHSKMSTGFRFYLL